jgi:hypothetical protein
MPATVPVIAATSVRSSLVTSAADALPDGGPRPVTAATSTLACADADALRRTSERDARGVAVRATARRRERTRAALERGYAVLEGASAGPRGDVRGRGECAGRRECGGRGIRGVGAREGAECDELVADRRLARARDRERLGGVLERLGVRLCGGRTGGDWHGHDLDGGQRVRTKRGTAPLTEATRGSRPAHSR